ncbi:Armadillo-type fold [Arabidopsis thaliana x Arabidopsis arenosa]|uniref:Armadillo-type fold n=1 Tax=Arabidopsis thaliana x Arabidopsis arenosa TaxID=1240361 RepID=A0A8T1XDS6_9BRAS|nr:Armadillo-type fold [Arabidopsis thaliana x Arabidopsis arenosa]
MANNDDYDEDADLVKAVDIIVATIEAKKRPLPPPSLPTFVPAPPVSEMTTTTTMISSTVSHPMQLQSSAGQKRNQIQVRDPFFSYSPPRELSQRVGGFNDALMDYSNSTVTAAKPISPTSSNRRCDSEKDFEIDRLKKELERVSKQLLDVEQECSQLKKGKNKEMESKISCADNKGQCSTVHAYKRTDLEPDVATSSVNHRENDSTMGLDDRRSFKTTGVQADLANNADLSKKLLDIWRTSNYQDPRKNLISELLLACSTDLQIIFSFMKISTPPQEVDKQEAKTSSDIQSEKVYRLYSAVTKISYGFVNLKSLVEPLLDLCKAETAVLVHRSLHVLHVLLEHICGVEKRFEASWDANWHSLFELMNQIASIRTEEDVKLEALSIMNIIVMSTDAYTARETFVSKEVFESISLLLRKEGGLHVRKEAIHLFYLLLNCPKLYDRFDSLHEEKNSSDTENDSEVNLFATEAFGKIFEGLADCLTSPRKTSEDLELCRNVIMILALAASSGNSGYELLSNHKLPQDTNFLMVILHLLVAEIDSESTESHPKAEIFKARTLLMREILILLNRLVSGLSSSATILKELTKSRDMASLTVDAATRLSRKRNLLGQPENSVQRMRNTEIMVLARIFKKRVFAFLGDNTI